MTLYLGEYSFLLYLTTIPSSWSRTIVGDFELTTSPSAFIEDTFRVQMCYQQNCIELVTSLERNRTRTTRPKENTRRQR